MVEAEVSTYSWETDCDDAVLHRIEDCDSCYGGDDGECSPAGEGGIRNCVGETAFFRVVLETRGLRTDS